MDHERVTNLVDTKQCSQCRGDTAYFCHSCRRNLCLPCKEEHSVDLDMRDHKVTLYREKYRNSSKSEMCAKHPNQIYEKYCEFCDVPVCFHCRKHRQHKLRDLRDAYKSKLQQHSETLKRLRSETLYNARVQLATHRTNVEKDVENCEKEVVNKLLNMGIKSKRLKALLDNILDNDSFESKYFFNHDFLKHRMIMSRKITRIRHNEQRYEESAINPVQFLRSVKRKQMQVTPYLIRYLVELLSQIQIRERGKRKVGFEHLLTQMPSPRLQKSFIVTTVDRCEHITCVKPDKIWVSDFKNLTLIDTTTDGTLYRVEDACRLWSGLHTINNECDLFYIDKDFNITKLSHDFEKTTTCIERTDYIWEPRCVYCSLFTEDLLVGMHRADTDEGKVARYNSNTGELSQTIPLVNIGHKLYILPHYLTENNNGDVVVSDFGRAVVVTERGGRHRFSYTGPHARSPLWPRGICTDALSHILVCDDHTDTVQMIDKDGNFLSHLLTKQSLEIIEPYSLNYDFNTHLLWLGSGYTISLYRHINRNLALASMSE